MWHTRDPAIEARLRGSSKTVQMLINVLDVGDGACTVASCCGDSVVVDCGSWRDNDGSSSASRLESALDSLRLIPQNFVVTHFDRDHWMGLHSWLSSRSRTMVPNARLIYPRLPSQALPVQRLLLAYESLRRASPWSAAIDMRMALANYARRPIVQAVNRGFRFRAGCEEWEVLWPPSDLPPGTSTRFDRVAREGRALADLFPPLADALEQAYRWAGVDSGDDEAARFEDVRLGEDVAFEDDSYDPGGEVDGDSLLDDLQWPDSVSSGLSTELADRLRRNMRDAQSLNNELSLVLHTVNGGFISFGDIQGWGSAALLRLPGIRDCYSIALAPHHGTCIPGPRSQALFPWSRLLIAQNGVEHEPRLKRSFLESKCFHLASTAASGSLIRFW